MALINCIDCLSAMSEDTLICFWCGRPMRKISWFVRWLMRRKFVMMMLVSILSSHGYGGKLKHSAARLARRKRYEDEQKVIAKGFLDSLETAKFEAAEEKQVSS